MEFFEKKNKDNPLLFSEISEAWKKTVEEKTLNNTEILSIKNNILLIKTQNPVYRNEITLNKAKILKEINKKLKIQKLKELKII